MLVTCSADEVTLETTDLHTAARTSLPYARIQRATWSVAVHVRDLVDRCKRLTGSVVDLDVHGLDGTRPELALSDGPQSFTLGGMHADDFPARPGGAEAWHAVTMQASTLAGAMDRVLYAASGDETRAHLHAMRVELTATRLRLVTTDGHRLALSDTNLPGVPPTLHNADPTPRLESLVAREGADHLRALVASKSKGDSALVRLSVSGKVLFAECRGVSMAFRLVEAMFPPYEQILTPVDRMARHAIVHRATLYAALKAVAVCSNKRTGEVRLSMDPASERLTLLAQSDAHGKGTDTLSAHYMGDPAPFVIGFNADYLIEALEVLPYQHVVLSTHDPLGPVRIAEHHGESVDTLAVVMPVRL